MIREHCSTVQHLGAVLAVVGLSLVLQAGMDIGSGFTRVQVAALDRGNAHTISAPDSQDWGATVLKLGGMP